MATLWAVVIFLVLGFIWLFFSVNEELPECEDEN